MKNPALWAVLLLLTAACQNQPTTTTESSELAEEVSTSQSTEGSYTQDDQENNIRLIQMTLRDIYKEDLEKDWIDTLSRQFKYSQVDLNQDGKKEILIGLTGPYFCGSGGCTLILTSHQGDVITQFSVVDYPVYVAKESSNGWQDLILYSGDKNRLVKFDGQSYPSNPSVLAAYSGDISLLEKLLDWESQEMFSF